MQGCAGHAGMSGEAADWASGCSEATVEFDREDRVGELGPAVGVTGRVVCGVGETVQIQLGSCVEGRGHRNDSSVRAVPEGGEEMSGESEVPQVIGCELAFDSGVIMPERDAADSRVEYEEVHWAIRRVEGESFDRIGVDEVQGRDGDLPGRQAVLLQYAVTDALGSRDVASADEDISTAESERSGSGEAEAT